MRVVKILVGSFVMIGLVTILSIGYLYYFVIGSSKSGQLFQILAKTSGENRGVFLSHFVPRIGKIKINGVENGVYVVEGVVLNTNKNKNEIGILNAGGYRRFTMNNQGPDVAIYRLLCSDPKAEVIPYSFSDFIGKVHKGDVVHLEYLVKNNGMVVIPVSLIKYVESIPSWDDNYPICIN